MEMLNKAKLYTYYIIIGVVSLIALVFLPMIGSTADMGFKVPDSAVGWVVWIFTRIIVAALNMLIFYCFMEQAKINVKDDQDYKEALQVLANTVSNNKERAPRSPEKWQAQQYSRKGVFIFSATLLGTVALTQAILTFDWVTMLTYLFTIIMGIIFGVVQMKSAELYWTTEFVRYADYVSLQSKRRINSEGPSVLQDIITSGPSVSGSTDCSAPHATIASVPSLTDEPSGLSRNRQILDKVPTPDQSPTIPVHSSELSRNREDFKQISNSEEVNQNDNY